jgi:hypothetical protein
MAIYEGGSYFFTGAVCEGTPDRTERLVAERDISTVSEIEVSIKMIADHVVSLVSRFAAPRGPKAVCEPCPPKAPARSEDLPCWSRTTPIRNKHTTTWMITSKMIIDREACDYR